MTNGGEMACHLGMGAGATEWDTKEDIGSVHLSVRPMACHLPSRGAMSSAQLDRTSRGAVESGDGRGIEEAFDAV